MLISVIIPVYNGERYIAAAIESVLKQSYPHYEIIAVDDGSTDNTAKIIKTYASVRYIYQPNQGPGCARNKGLMAAKGDFIAFLDADDGWAPNKLKLQMDFLSQHPNTDFVIAHMLNFLETDMSHPNWVRSQQINIPIPAHLLSALLARKQVFDQIGGFDTNYKHSNDSDWFFRAKDADIVMAVLPDILLYRRIHPHNLSQDVAGLKTEVLKVVSASIKRKRDHSATNKS